MDEGNIFLPFLVSLSVLCFLLVSDRKSCCFLLILFKTESSLREGWSVFLDSSKSLTPRKKNDCELWIMKLAKNDVYFVIRKNSNRQRQKHILQLDKSKPEFHKTLDITKDKYINGLLFLPARKLKIMKAVFHLGITHRFWS